VAGKELGREGDLELVVELIDDILRTGARPDARRRTVADVLLDLRASVSDAIELRDLEAAGWLAAPHRRRRSLRPIG
jgi:hypothetical protein